ncbi:DUF4367 domain-containing protein [Gorillibacterium sp. sgz5001074]|uniref:DUF4367 domain-containing protein n=1 Tax=Gorillibacterium sp. sgz5001074 TaxID=3446695 RepID=UPI003F67DC18
MRDNRRPSASESETRLAEALRAYYGELPVPDGSEAWESMNDRWNGGMGRKHGEAKHPIRYWLKLGVVAAALTLIIHLLFWAVNPVQAIMRYYFEVYKSGDVTDITFGNYDMSEPPKGMLTGPPPEEDKHGKFVRGETRILGPGETPPMMANPSPPPDPYERVYGSVEEAQPHLAFPVRLPSPMPTGYLTEQVRFYLSPGEDKGTMAWMIFRNPETRDTLYVSESFHNGAKMGFATTIGGTEDVEVRELDVAGTRGILIKTKMYAEIRWYTDTMYYELRGRFPEKEILAMADSIGKQERSK